MTDYLKTLLDSVGVALQDDDTVKEYNAAREEYIADTEITSAVSEYNVQRMLLDEQQMKPDADQTLVESISARVEALYEKIMTADSMKRLAAAENALNALLNDVNKTIMSYIIPETESSCGGDCGHCHGCH